MLCFAGLATMFYFMMRNIDELTRMLKEDRNQMQTNLRALESSLNHLGDLLGRLTADPDAPRGGIPGRSDPLRPDSLRSTPVPGMAAPIQMAAGLASQLQSRPVTVTPLQTAAPESGETPAAPDYASPPSAPAFAGSGELNLSLAPQAKAPASSAVSPTPVSSAAEPGASALPSLSLDGDRQSRRR